MPKDQKKKSGRQNYNWNPVKHDYITDPSMSLRKVAKKYDISLDAVAHKSKAEGWFAARKEHQNKIVTKAITQTDDKLAAELSQESDFLALMKGHMSRMLSDQEQYQRHIITNPYTGETEERICNKFDSKAMKDSMQMLQMMEAMTRSLYNIQKATELQKAKNDAERLALEREKFEWEKQKADMMKPDKSAVIRIEGFEQEWAE